MTLKKVVVFFLVIFLIKSCAKDVDFNQLDDASIQTTYLSTLLFSNFDAPKFLNEFNEEITVSTDFIEAPIADDSKPYLEKVEFTIITNNTFDRSFVFHVIFYDDFGTPIYTLNPILIIPKNTSKLTSIIEIPQNDIHFLYDTRYFGFTLSLSTSTDGSVLLASNTSTLELKSFVKLFFNF